MIQNLALNLGGLNKDNCLYKIPRDYFMFMYVIESCNTVANDTQRR